MDHFRRALVGSLCAVLAVLGTNLEAGAQSAPPTSTGVADPVAAPSATSTPATVPGDPGPTTTVDPLLNELPGETVPTVEGTVPPPRGAYGGQGEFKPAQVLWSSVRQAEAKLTEVRWIHEELIRQARQARLQHKALRVQQGSLDTDRRRAVAGVQAGETELRERAVAAFVSNDDVTEALLGSLQAASHDRVLELQVRQRLLGVALNADEQAIASYLQLRAQLDQDLLATVDSLRAADVSIVDLETRAGRRGRA